MTRSLAVAASLVLSSTAAAEPAAKPAVGARLATYTGSARNYRSIRKDVLTWHKTSSNGCVAYASTALRHIGVDVPLSGVRDGWGISRITFAFSDHLEQELRWVRVAASADLEPGDLVFTTGAPDHVFVFHSWMNKRRFVVRAIDNQGFKKPRRLHPRPDGGVAAFSYALRAP